MNEQVVVYLATDLADASAGQSDDERIEVVKWPLTDLDGAITATNDAKTIIGLCSSELDWPNEDHSAS